MAATVRCTEYRRDESGRISVTFEGGTTKIYNSIDDMKSAVAQIDNGPEGEELARMALIGRLLRLDPDASDSAVIVDRTCTINLGAPIVVSIG